MKKTQPATRAATQAPEAPSVDAPDATPGIGLVVTGQPELPVMPVTRIESARELPELVDSECVAALVQHGIQSFKDNDRRTMHVVALDGAIYKQEVVR